MTTIAGREVAAGLTGDGETRILARARVQARWPFWPAAAVLVLGLLIIAALTLVSATLNRDNEKRLLGLRAREVGTVLTEVVPSIQTPLASAAALADATRGNVAKFKRFADSYVGPSSDKTFVSMSLWRVRGAVKGPIAVVGLRPALALSPGRATALFERGSARRTLGVIGFLQSPLPRLGYAFAGPGPGPYAAYGESAVPPSRYAPVQSNAAFSDIDYAVYLGPSTSPATLIIASVRHLPLKGRIKIVRSPIGDSFFTVAVTARGQLGGSLPGRLTPAIAILGALLSLGAALVTARLIERRRGAERLAARLEEIAEENQRLYAEQRGIAQTLQHAGLPDRLPQPPGLEASARYEAGAHGVEIGGDWYDAITIDSRRLLLVVGDVSGKGLRAATTMSALRYAIRAYATQGDPPEELLSKLSKLVSVKADRQLATVLCALIDVPARRITVTSAGHLPPLIIAGESGEYVQGKVGLPVGVDAEASYGSTTISAPPGATFLVFTDGLVERRGESIDAGLERLRARAREHDASLDELLTRLLDDARDDSGEDDIVIAGIRWTG